MSIFSFSDAMEEAPRPGIFSMIKSHLWDLFLFNLISFFCCAPLLFGIWMLFIGSPVIYACITVMASAFLSAPCCRAMARIIRQMADGCCFEPIRSFFSAFKEEYLRSVAMGFFYHLLLCGLLLGAMKSFAGAVSSEESAWVVLLWLCALAGMFVAGSVFHAFMMLANINLGFFDVLRNAFLLGAANILRTVLSLGFVAALTVVCFILPPYSLCLLPLCYFSLVWSFCGWFSWQTIKEHIALPEQKEET